MRCLSAQVVKLGYIFKIVTHHSDTRRAAEAWARLGVCAVGYIYDSEMIHADREEIKAYMYKKRKRKSAIPADAGAFIRFRDDIQIGELVFAYVGSNIVGLVGEVEGDVFFDDENEVGDVFYYPNQRRVNWWPEPRFFDRRELPHDVSEWIKMRGTILRRKYKVKSLKQEIRKIKSGVMKDSLETENEIEIQDFIENNIEKIEEGLVLVERERTVAGKSMDFLARDKRGFYTVIEVKQLAKPDALTQLRGYIRDYKKETGLKEVRGMLVALDFSRRCTEEWEELSEAGFEIDLVRVKKTFTFTHLDSNRSE